MASNEASSEGHAAAAVANKWPVQPGEREEPKILARRLRRLIQLGQPLRDAKLEDLRAVPQPYFLLRGSSRPMLSWQWALPKRRPPRDAPGQPTSDVTANRITQSPMSAVSRGSASATPAVVRQRRQPRQQLPCFGAEQLPCARLRSEVAAFRSQNAILQGQLQQRTEAYARAFGNVEQLAAEAEAARAEAEAARATAAAA